MSYVVMAYIAMAYIVMSYVVMAYIVWTPSAQVRTLSARMHAHSCKHMHAPTHCFWFVADCVHLYFCRAIRPSIEHAIALSIEPSIEHSVATCHRTLS